MTQVRCQLEREELGPQRFVHINPSFLLIDSGHSSSEKGGKLISEFWIAEVKANTKEVSLLRVESCQASLVELIAFDPLWA